MDEAMIRVIVYLLSFLYIIVGAAFLVVTLVALFVTKYPLHTSIFALPALLLGGVCLYLAARKIGIDKSNRFVKVRGLLVSHPWRFSVFVVLLCICLGVCYGFYVAIYE